MSLRFFAQPNPHLLTWVMAATAVTLANPVPSRAAGPEVGVKQTTANQTNFRVDIKVYEGDDEQPIDEHLVLFQDAMIYDFDLINTHSITVIDPKRKRVVLINRQQETRCQLKTDDLTAMIAHLKVRVSDPSIKEKLGLTAKVEFDSDADTYSIQFDRVRYQTTVQETKDQSVSFQFAQFADWASRLNVARKRGLPPFARMSLNQSLAEAGRLPAELKVELRRGLKKSRYSTRHEVVEAISESDRKKIDEVGGMLALYREVALSEMP